MTPDRYLKSRGIAGEWVLKGCSKTCFTGAVVIPALAESANLFSTLESLSASPQSELDNFIILVVVNNRLDASDADKADNQHTLALLPEYANSRTKLNLAWIDAASKGKELPLKNGGVGMARKIGADLALTVLDYSKKERLIVFLDADTIVRPDYLSAITNHFRANPKGAAVIPFIHQQQGTKIEHSAIERYELFLRSYVFGLKLSGSQYAFHTIGSAMACKVSSYIKSGGMNCRQAAEDFYFLQQLARVDGVSELSGTIVYPSSRPSHRVPFGTGKAISRVLAEGENSILFYNPNCFKVLRELLSLVNSNASKSSVEFLHGADSIDHNLYNYLASIDAKQIWEKLEKNNKEHSRFMKAFHEWFDGLKTLKLIHYLSDVSYPRCKPDVALPELLKWGNIENKNNLSDWLDTLRKLQNSSHGNC